MIRRLDRNRVRRLAGQRGFTLPEVLVVTMLLGIIGGLVSTLVIATYRTGGDITMRQRNVDTGHTAMDALTKALRVAVEPAQVQQTLGVQGSGSAATATALTSATPNSVTLFADFGASGGSGPDLVTFATTANSDGKTLKLTETLRKPDPNSAPNWTYTCTKGSAGCVVVTRSIAPNLLLPAANSLFTYYDNAGNVLTPAGSPAALSAQQLISVDRIGVTLPVRTPNGYGTPAYTVTNQIELPNAVSGVLPTPSPTG